MKNFLKTYWELLTFQMKDSIYDRWFEISSSVIVLVGTLVVIYGIIKSLS